MRAQLRPISDYWLSSLTTLPASITWLTSSAEFLGQPEKAQELARKAQTVSGNSPAVLDTLGWVLYKRAS